MVTTLLRWVLTWAVMPWVTDTMKIMWTTPLDNTVGWNRKFDVVLFVRLLLLLLLSGGVPAFSFFLLERR